MVQGQKYRLIPMQIEGIMIPENDGNVYANINPNFNSLKVEPSGKAIEASPFTLRNRPETAGIHIHWILPEETTHGKQKEEGGEIAYPPIPDRYLVTRLFYEVSGTKKGPVGRKTWIVESDSVTAKRTEGNQNSSMIPAAEDVKQTYRYLGESREFGGEVTEGAAHMEKLTACVNGSPYYAAYYPMCRNVLGFYDGMEDIEPIAGRGGTVSVSYVVTGWYCREEEGGFCNHVYHGLLYGLKWQGRHFPYPSGIPRLDNVATVSVGNSQGQAMAALVAFHKNSSLSGHIVESLMAESLQDWSRLDGMLEDQYQMHGNGFSTVQTGRITEIYREGEPKEGRKKDGPGKRGRNALLLSIQNWQAAGMDLVFEKERLVQELADIWRCYACDDADDLWQKAQEEIGRRTLRLQKLGACYGRVQNHIGQKSRKLEMELDGQEELRSREDQRYYICNNLTVMLEGAGRNTMLDNRAKEEENYRCEGEIRNAGGAEALFTKKLSEMPVRADERTREILDIAQSLVGEALLEEKAGYGREYEAPFNPLLLEWELEFYPDRELLNDCYTLKNWALEGLDFEYQSPSFDKKEVLRGRTLLTDHASHALKDALERFIKVRDGTYVIEEMPYQVLSQALTGFRESLLCRKQDVQYPARAVSGLDPRLAAITQSWLKGAETLTADDKKGFYPLLAGCVRFTSFHVIDGFGRVQVLKPAAVIVPDRCETVEYQMNTYLVVPPRLLMPSRLHFQWQNAKDGMPCADFRDTSPLCGFIWPNFAESSLLIYSQEGKMLGSVQTVYHLETGLAETVWRNAPGENYLHQGYPEELLPEMRRIVEGICIGAQKEKDLLVHLLQMMDESFWNIYGREAQESDAGFAVLGHPIAVARAQVALQIQGKMKEPPASLSGKKKPSARLEETLFPVHFGNPGQKGDGTVGFYDLEEAEPFSRLHVCGVGHEGIHGGGYLDGRSGISLGVSEKGGHHRLIFLLSPYGKMHMISGILPVKKVSLPGALVGRALKNIFYTLYCAPVMTPSSAFSLPCLHSEGRRWSYLQRMRNGTWQETEEIREAQAESFLFPPPYELAEGWLKQTEE